MKQVRPLSVPRPPSGYPYTYVAEINALAGGGASGSDTISVDASNDFEVLAVLLTAYFTSGVVAISRSNLIGGQPTGTVTTGVGGTPTANFESLYLDNQVKLYRDGQPNPMAVAGPGLHNLRLAFKTNDRDWQSRPVRADLLTGEPGRLFFLPRPQLIKANSTVSITAFNDMVSGANAGTANTLRGIRGNDAGTAAPTVNLQVALFGSKLVRGTVA